MGPRKLCIYETSLCHWRRTGVCGRINSCFGIVTVRLLLRAAIWPSAVSYRRRRRHETLVVLPSGAFVVGTEWVCRTCQRRWGRRLLQRAFRVVVQQSLFSRKCWQQCLLYQPGPKVEVQTNQLLVFSYRYVYSLVLRTWGRDLNTWSLSCQVS
jgi:hypothetical protein